MTQEKKKRQSRLFRNPNPRTIQLTDRRVDELDILYWHRLASTDIFQAVLPGSNRKIQEELRLLYDNGYIDRPLEQFIMHKKHQGGHGRTEIIYALANKGMEVLANLGYPVPKTDLNRKNKELGETTIFHDLTLTKLWACLKTALEQKRERTQQPYNLVFWYQDRANRAELKTELTLHNGRKINIIPDVAFKFQCPISQYLFFVEYYRTRKGGHQNYLDKLKLYNLYYQQRKFQQYRVKKGFRIITLVPTKAIAENLIKRINAEEQNKELRHFKFWFLAEEDYRLYHKERVLNKTYFKKTLDVESILEPIFRTPIDKRWHRLEE